MKSIIISLSFIVASANAANYCWSLDAGYPCCPDGYDEVVEEEIWGKWGIYNNMWCGIMDKRDRCWAQASSEDYTFCKYGTQLIMSDQDGDWGWDYERSTYCGMRNSHPRWNDRALVEETKEEWNKFKDDWDNNLKYDFTRISVFVGEDESKLNFGWYSTQPEIPTICWSTTEVMRNCKLFTGTYEEYYSLKGVQYYSNQVTVTGIERNSVYYYARIMDGKLEEIYTFRTYDEDDFNFIFVGDPQIGGSRGRISIDNNYQRVLNKDEGTRNDAFNWNRTVSNSIEFARTPSLFLSAGDQADEEEFVFHSLEKFVKDNEKVLYMEETQYSAFLLPEKLKTLPVAAAVGNHDSYNENFRHHFNVPNPYTTGSTMLNSIIPGYNYYFKYNNVLVVVLESNYGTCMDYSIVIEKAVNAYPDLDWRIALFHHDIFGNGEYHSLEFHIVEELRPCLTGLLSDYGFDLAINGHDHIYAASKFITYDPLDIYHYSEPVKRNEVYTNPPGTLYITANCSTGSKLYGFVGELDYINFYNQTYTSTFGMLDFKKENGKVRLTVTSYEVEGYQITDGPYIIEKDVREKIKCWAEEQGYKCCPKGYKPIYVDSKGYKWGYLNDYEWCGIIEPEEPLTTTTITINTTDVIETETETTADVKEIETDIETDTTTYTTENETEFEIEIETITIIDTTETSSATSTTIATITTTADVTETPILSRTTTTTDVIETETETEATTTSATITTNPESESTTIINTTITKIVTSTTTTSTATTTTTTTKTLPSNLNNCWATALGYPCCTDPNAQTYYIDDNGFWSVENDDWCGRIISDNCWSLKYGYPCCKNQLSVIVANDEYGKWSIENGDWCGLY